MRRNGIGVRSALLGAIGTSAFLSACSAKGTENVGAGTPDKNASAAVDTVKQSTAFFCSVHVKFVSGKEQELPQPRRFAFLLDGSGPFSAIETIDHTQILNGASVEQFQLAKADGSAMAGTAGAKLLSISNPDPSLKDMPGMEAFAAAIGNGSDGSMEYVGLCYRQLGQMTRVAFDAKAHQLGYDQ